MLNSDADYSWIFPTYDRQGIGIESGNSAEDHKEE